jgi:hypothetical protein
MQRWLTIGLVLFVIVVVLLIVGLAATLLVVFAYGLGWLFTRFLPFEIGQATLLALIALISAAICLWRILSNYVSSTLQPSSSDDDDDADADDDDEWDEDELDEADEPAEFVASIPRWRQPIKPVKFEGANRNGPCPCGSGRKYKYCHGRTR